MRICLKCNEEIPNRININNKIHTLHKRKYCIKCSPFYGRNNKKIHIKEENILTKYCSRCEKNKAISEFYKRKNKHGYTHYCISCLIKQATERQRKLKKEAIDYKGGRCQICLYNKCVAALEFHHLDRKNKKFNISHIKTTKLNNLLLEELDKCVLLCSNCHREVESGITKCLI
jgi:hypothetical protein